MKGFLSRLFSRCFQKGAAPALDGRAGVARAARPVHAHADHPMANAPMLDCESVMRQLWDYLDGELTPERMAQIRAHIEMCKRCYPQYEFERSFLDALAARQRSHSNPERLNRKLMAALHERGLSEA